MINIAKEINLSPYFLGAYREKNLSKKDTWDGVIVNRVGIFYPMLNGKNVFKYVFGVMAYNFHSFCFLFKDKPDLVHSSDVETFFAGYLYCLLFRKKLIYNIHDNFSQRYQLPKMLAKILNQFEGMLVALSTVSIVPEVFRRESLPRYCQKKIEVIKNTPKDQGLKSPSTHFGKESITIIYAGWIDSGRGLDELLRLGEVMPEVKIILAGEGDTKLIKDLQQKNANKNKISYLGFITHDEIMQATANADFVFAFYNPVKVINRYAAPNKVAEALSLGRPVIINKEVLISKEIEIMNCGVIVSYDDIEQLVAKLRTLIANPQQYYDKCQNARKLFEKEYLWETARAKSLELLTNLINTV